MVHDPITTMMIEVKVMVQYSSGEGLTLPDGILTHLCQFEKILSSEQEQYELLDEQLLVDLSNYHAVMTQLVKPARPKTLVIVNSNKGRKGLLSFLGPIPLVRNLVCLSIFFMLAIIGLALSPEVNKISMNQGIFDASGMTLFLNLLFLLSCAGIGGTFACLYQINSFIGVGIYDPKYDASYWVRIIMGLMSGLMICELLPMNDLVAQSDQDMKELDKPLAALLGGFCSDLIHRILSRFVKLVDQLFGHTQTLPVSKDSNAIESLNQMKVVIQKKKVEKVNTEPAVQPTVDPTVELTEDIMPVNKSLPVEVSEKRISNTEPEVGKLTYDAEGMEGGRYHSRILHVPADTSGVTLGRGYDFKEKSSIKIKNDLVQAGVAPDVAETLSQASGLYGDLARTFITNLQLSDFEISMETQNKLFTIIYAELSADVQRICNKTDCVAAYGSVDWDNLNPKIKEVIIDLRYRGDYIPKSRKLLQSYVANNDLPSFSHIIKQREHWEQVPLDRFNRRAQYLSS